MGRRFSDDGFRVVARSVVAVMYRVIVLGYVGCDACLFRVGGNGFVPSGRELFPLPRVGTVWVLPQRFFFQGFGGTGESVLRFSAGRFCARVKSFMGFPIKILLSG